MGVRFTPGAHLSYIVILKQNVTFDILFGKHRIPIYRTQKLVIQIPFCCEFAIIQILEESPSGYGTRLESVREKSLAGSSPASSAFASPKLQ